MTETGKRAENATISDLGIKNSTAHWNLTPSELIAISLKEGQAKLTSQKAITINTGKFTGRSPMDRFIVKDKITNDTVWWGKTNLEFNEHDFDILYKKVVSYLTNKEIYVRDAYACADEKYKLNIRVVNEYAWSNLFAYNMFLRPDDKEINRFSHEFCFAKNWK